MEFVRNSEPHCVMKILHFSFKIGKIWTMPLTTLSIFTWCHFLDVIHVPLDIDKFQSSTKTIQFVISLLMITMKDFSLIVFIFPDVRIILQLTQEWINSNVRFVRPNTFWVLIVYSVFLRHPIQIVQGWIWLIKNVLNVMSNMSMWMDSVKNQLLNSAKLMNSILTIKNV